MLTIESRFFVAGVCGRGITDFMLDCTDGVGGRRVCSGSDCRLGDPGRCRKSILVEFLWPPEREAD
jgi:hypothetical protein